MDSLVNDIITCNLSIREIAGENMGVDKTHSIVAKRIKQFQIRGLPTKKYLWYVLNNQIVAKIGILCNEYISSIDIYRFRSLDASVHTASWDMLEPYAELDNKYLMTDAYTVLYKNMLIYRSMKTLESCRESEGITIMGTGGGMFVLPSKIIDCIRDDIISDNIPSLEQAGVEFPIGNIITHLMNESSEKSYFLRDHYYQMCDLLTSLAGEGYWNYWTRNINGSEHNTYRRIDFMTLAKYEPTYVPTAFELDINGVIQAFNVILPGDPHSLYTRVVYDALLKTYINCNTHETITDASIADAITMLKLLESVGLKRAGICI